MLSKLSLVSVSHVHSPPPFPPIHEYFINYAKVYVNEMSLNGEQDPEAFFTGSDGSESVQAPHPSRIGYVHRY